MIGIVAIKHDSTSFTPDYGYLYNWYAINTGLLAPLGWHVPSYSEIQTLSTYLGSNAGGKLKEVGTTHWTSPNNGATNSTGFYGLGTGFRTVDGYSYIGRTLDSTYGTSTANTLMSIFSLHNISTNLEFDGIYTSLKAGVAIRCIKDDSNDPGNVIDYDGNIYPTTKIGTQVWMVLDLKTTHYRNGTSIPNVPNQTNWNNLTTGAYCYYGQTGAYVPSVKPTVRTGAARQITSTSAYSDVLIDSPGDSDVTQRGIQISSTSAFSSFTTIYSTSSDLNITAVYLSSLTDSVVYYIRAFATNSVGTSYGSVLSFTATHNVQIGDLYGGGMVIYLFTQEDIINVKSNDSYINTNVKGIVVGLTDLDTCPFIPGNPFWYITPILYYTVTYPNYIDFDYLSIGTSNYNTRDLHVIYNEDHPNYAAFKCYYYSYNGYQDWSLPNSLEFSFVKNLSSAQKTSINLLNANYWTSELLYKGMSIIGLANIDIYSATVYNPITNVFAALGNQNNAKVRPIRYFT